PHVCATTEQVDRQDRQRRERLLEEIDSFRRQVRHHAGHWIGNACERHVSDDSPRFGQRSAEPHQRIFAPARGLDNSGVASDGGFCHGHRWRELHALSGHDISHQVIEECVRIDRAEQGVHSLPAVVEILTVEIRVEVADAVEWRAGWTSFKETLCTDRFANGVQSVAIDLERIGGPVVELFSIDAWRVLGYRVLAIELVVFKSPLIKRLELPFEEGNHLRVTGIERRCAVIEYELARLVAQVPIRVLRYG